MQEGSLTAKIIEPVITDVAYQSLGLEPRQLNMSLLLANLGRESTLFFTH